MGYIAQKHRGYGWFDNYPHGGIPDYTYTSAFQSEFPKTGNAAESQIKYNKNLVAKTVSQNGQGGAAIVELDRMINIARNAEIRFLNEHGLMIVSDWSDLITGINKILSTQVAFERNVRLLQQLNNNQTSKYEDVTVFFREKLQKAIYNELEKNLISSVNVNLTGQQILENAVKKTISEMADITDTEENGLIKTKRTENEELQLKAFQELFGTIKYIKQIGLVNKLSEIFSFEQYIQEATTHIRQTQSGQRIKKPTLKYKGGNNTKGTLSEILYNEVVRGLGRGQSSDGHIQWKTIEHTGGLNYKPDRILATGTLSYNLAASKATQRNDFNDRTKRGKGIAVMEEFYKNMQKAKGDIVIISDKNYLINKGFIEGRTLGGHHHLGGFKAQDVTSLDALDGLFSSLHITAFKIDQLINYLANIGSNLIFEDIDPHILTVISTQIGNFLFDDLSFDTSAVPQSVNLLHIFQLSGIYVPLSIVLEGVKNGLNSAMSTDVSSFVEVQFNSSSDTPDKWTGDRNTSDATFQKFRKTKTRNNKLEINFLKDFARIIAENVII